MFPLKPVIVCLLFLACACASADPTSPIPGLRELHDYDGPLALVDVNVVTMADGPVAEPGRSVVLRDGRIEAIRPAGAALPADARVLDAGGRYLLPGLADMHVHLLERSFVADFLRSGVTTVRDLWGWSLTLELRAEADAGGQVPWVVAAGPGIDGSPPVRSSAVILDDPDLASALVSDLLADDWDGLKVYQNLRLDAFLALADAADAAGVELFGHVPTAVPLDSALGRMRSIEHLEGYDKALTGGRLRAFRSWAGADTTGAAAIAARTAASGTWNTPTLLVMRRALERNATSDEAARGIRNARRMVSALQRAGAPILAGTDAGVPIIPAGESIHDELEELVMAGLTPYQALGAATAEPARFLGREGEFGVIREGARADLLLLEENPLADLSTARGPRAVILRGRLLVPSRID